MRTHFPESAEEVVSVVRAAADAGTRLMPAGRGSWPRAGGWAREAGAIVSMSRMNEVLHYEPADLTLTAGAGLGMDDLAQELEHNGQWLPLDGPGCAGGTLGAVVACGVSGPLQARYGGVRDNVLGLELVTGDGRLLRIGGRVVKNVAGYDMVRLLTGSRGSLGVITRVSVRLYPRPATDVTLCFRAEGAARAVEMARAVCTGAFPVAAVEVVEEAAGRADGARNRGGMVLMVRLLGGAEEVKEGSGRVAARVGPAPGEVLRGGDSVKLHRRRIGWEAEWPGEGADGDNGPGVVVRLTALPDRLGRTLECAGTVAGVVRGEVAADAMGGLVRVKGSCPASRMDEVVERLVAAREEMEVEGGSLTLSEAPRDLAARVGWTGAGGVGVGGLAERIKALFDPGSVLASECP